MHFQMQVAQVTVDVHASGSLRHGRSFAIAFLELQLERQYGFGLLTRRPRPRPVGIADQGTHLVDR